jgi:hypothetical protein
VCVVCGWIYSSSAPLAFLSFLSRPLPGPGEREGVYIHAALAGMG